MKKELRECTLKELMTLLKEAKLYEEFRNPRIPRSEQQAGDHEVEHDVQDLLDYARRNLPIRSIPLKMLVPNVPPYTLPGDSDEEDNSLEFKQRTYGLSLRDFIDGRNYPPILVIKNNDGTYHVFDGRHRVVSFIRLLRTAGKTPLNHKIKGYIMTEHELNTIPSTAQKFDRTLGN